MLEYIKQEANQTYTENGAATYATTGSDCLDLFATIGALRRESDEEIITRFLRAYAENADSAMKLLFFARDIRGGLGERRVFRTSFTWLAFNKPESVRRNLRYVAEFGRWDDLLALMGTPCEGDMLQLLKEQFDTDLAALKANKPVSLLGKWLPSVNASNTQAVRHAKRIAKAFGLKEADYRKALSALRKDLRILENNLREKDYSFDYEKQPSRAMFKYRMAFLRNDGNRYLDFLSRTQTGEATLHADNVAPYELVERCLDFYSLQELSPQEEAAINATWNALPNFCGEENTLAVVDTSSSMYGWSGPKPISVALALGLFFAEHNRGAFAGHFMEFSHRPELIQLKGETFIDRLRYAASFCEIADTNLEAVFDQLLAAAVKHQVPQEELPTRLIIISDMEFNCCMEDASAVNFQHAKEKFAAHGYQLPGVVFWNVASRNRQQPVTQNEEGVALISGATPRLFEMVASGTLEPSIFMQEILQSQRYAKITA